MWRSIPLALIVAAGCSAPRASSIPAEPEPNQASPSEPARASHEEQPRKIEPEPASAPEPAPQPEAPAPIAVDPKTVADVRAELARRKVDLVLFRDVIVQVDDCARLPSPPMDRKIHDFHETCSIVLQLDEFESADLDAHLGWALGVSTLPEVGSVFVYGWHEYRSEGVWEEEYAEIVDGALVGAAAFDSSKDRKWRKIRRERAAHEHMWTYWPLSDVARRLGFSSRGYLVYPTLIEFMGGREYPPDTAGFERTLFTYVHQTLIESLEACAAKEGSSPDALLDAWALELGADGLAEFGRQPRQPHGDKRPVEYALTSAAFDAFGKASLDADTSYGHMLQNLIASRCAPAKTP